MHRCSARSRGNILSRHASGQSKCITLVGLSLATTPRLNSPDFAENISLRSKPNVSVQYGLGRENAQAHSLAQIVGTRRDVNSVDPSSEGPVPKIMASHIFIGSPWPS